MHPLATIIKRLKDNGIFDAIIEGKPIEQRKITGDPWTELGWHPWTGSQTVLFEGGDSWEVRIKPQPREWWIGWCHRHGPGARVYGIKPQHECPDCQIVHVVEDLK